ncbi:hypothetical protein PCANC_09064 [Puccinia coronata f. sp. avenae]|uniref:Uncharacterized protein n=1 Tax=Puccinia coronata f. sp. avenae TaxID=200324 RepID=A0A2N5SX02_9BASI|nr:hypothetical protein PCANC_09064 [Puccinia coronata f. sp. avenae]
MDGPSKTMAPWLSLETPLKKTLYHHRTTVSAAISSMLATMAAFPLDSIKSRLQVNNYDSVMDCVKKTYVEEGPKGFYRGIAIPMLTITIVRTLSFTIYNDTKQFLHQRQLVSSTSARDIALSGLAGGAASGFLISVGSCAFELVKIRSQLESAIAAKQDRPLKDINTWRGAREIISSHGLKGLYFGFNLHCLRDTLGTGLYFLGYDTARFFSEKKIDEIEYRRSLEPAADYGFVLPRSALPFLCGSTCGVASWFIIYPLDVVKSRLQRDALASSIVVPTHNPQNVNGKLTRSSSLSCTTRNSFGLKAAFELFQQLISKSNGGGIKVLYSGLSISAFRSFFQHGVMWTILESYRLNFRWSSPLFSLLFIFLPDLRAGKPSRGWRGPEPSGDRPAPAGAHLILTGSSESHFDSIRTSTTPPMESSDNSTHADDSSDAGSESEEQSSGKEQSGPSDKVHATLRKLLRKYQFSLNQMFCREDENLTLDQMDEKIDCLHDLRTSVLPSIKRQILDLLQSLDLSEQPTYPCPDPELTTKIISEMHRTIGKAMSAAETIGLEAPQPEPSHDRQLKEFKQFRSNRILWKTKAVIHQNLCDLLETFGMWLLEWDRQEDREDVEFQTKSAETGRELSALAVSARIEIDAVLEWLSLSDLAIIQEEWQGPRRKASDMLAALAEMLNGTYVWRKKADQNEQADETDLEKKKAHRARAIQLARWAIPMVKLTRLFYTKLCTTSQLPFTLDPEISSKEHDELRDKVGALYARIDRVLGGLCFIYETDEDLANKIRGLREVTLRSTGDLDRALLALSFHIAPLHPAASPSALQRDFKDFFRPLTGLLLVATTNFRDAVTSCFGELDESESD